LECFFSHHAIAAYQMLCPRDKGGMITDTDASTALQVLAIITRYAANGLRAPRNTAKSEVIAKAEK
jgi:hypothetical protein